jgi:hypothetical protein
MLIHSTNCSPQLRELFARYPGVRLAEPDDSAAIAEFINQTSMSSGELRIGFTRGHDYFALHQLQSEKHAALLCEDEGKIVGVAALTLRSAKVRNQLMPVGYLQDLRVAHDASHRIRQNFYKFFSEFVRTSPELPDFSHCSLFISAILDENSIAKSALSRQSFPLEYTRLARYTAHVWPKLPLIAKILGGNARAQEAELAELVDFYEENLGKYAFDLTADDVRRIANHSTPVVLRDAGKIIAACLLVQTSNERKLTVEQSKLNLKFEACGTYITALRHSKSLIGQRALEAKTVLFGRAVRESLKHPGLFTGFIETENNPIPLSLVQRNLKYSINGSLYRVFHPSHTSLPEFSEGFLRPSHSAAFEWIFS